MTSEAKYFWKFLLSYILVMLLPIILTMVVVQNSITDMMKQNFRTYTSDSLNQTMSIVDSTLTNSINLLTTLNSDEFVLNASAGLSNYNIYQAQKQLVRYKLTNEYLKDIAIYLKEQDKIIATSGIYSTRNFYNTVYHSNQYENFKTELNAADFNSSIALDNNSQITLAYDFKINTYSTLMVLIDKNIIKKSLSSVIASSKNSVAIIIDNNDKVIVQEGDYNPDEQGIRNLLQCSDKTTKVKLEGKWYYAFKKSSVYNGYSYIVAIPVVKFEHSAFSSLVFLYLLIVVVVFISGAVIFYSMKNNYNPLRDIINYTKRMTNSDIKDMYSVQNVVENIVSTNELLESEVKRSKGHVRRQLLQELLLGSTENITEISELLTQMESISANADYAVLIVSLDGASYHESDIDDLIFDVASENIRIYDVKGLITDGVVIVLSAATLSYEEVSVVTDNIYDFFVGKFGANITISVGSICDDIRKVAQSYIDATSALDWQFVLGKGGIIEFDKLPKEFVGDIPQIAGIGKLNNLIKRGDINGLIEIIDDIITELCSGDYHLHGVKYACYDIINSVIRSMHEINVSPSALSRDYLNVISINECKTIYELVSIISDMCREACEIIIDSKESGNTKFCYKIVEYMDEHFCDFNFSLDSMANSFDMSYSYMSRYFKDQTGKNITEYISEKRIEKAKQLLITTKFTVFEIMSSVGYSSITSFGRKFKQATGMTPKDFRSVNKV